MTAPSARGSRSLRNVETNKKKARRTAGRPPQTRIQGNTLGARSALKKAAGKARQAKAKAAGLI